MSEVERSFHLIPKEHRQKYVDAIIGYFHSERGEEIGVVAAEEMLDFFLEHVAPAVYNRGLDDAQKIIEENVDTLAFKLGELRR